MDVRALRYFTTIADLGSFSAASRRLRIAQPALSRQVRLLEEELGSPLLLRSSNGVGLTAAGERLYRHAEALLHQFGRTREVVQGAAGEVTGQVTIGLPSTLCEIVARPFLQAALQRYPKVRIRLVESLGSVLQEMLENGDLDFAVLYNARSSGRLSVSEVLVEELCLALAPGSIPLTSDAIEFRDLAGYPLVMPSRAQSVRRLLESMALSEGIELAMRLEVDSITLTKQIVEMGLAAAVLSQGVVHREEKRGILATVRIVNPTIRRSVAIASTTAPPSIAVQRMQQLFQRACEGLVGSGQWRASLLPRPSRGRRTVRHLVQD